MSYIPAKDADFDVWFLNFKTLAASDGEDNGLSAGQVTALGTAYTTWHSSYIQTTIPTSRNATTIAAKDAARVAATTLIQDAAAMLQAFPSNNSAIILAYGLTDRKTTRTPVPAPTATPVLSAQSLKPLEVTLRVKDLENDSNRFPPNVVGANIYMKVNSPAPVDKSTMVFVGRMTKRFFLVNFTEDDVNKPVYFLAEYVTRTNKIGPSSAILGTTVAQ